MGIEKRSDFLTVSAALIGVGAAGFSLYNLERQFTEMARDPRVILSQHIFESQSHLATAKTTIKSKIQSKDGFVSPPGSALGIDNEGIVELNRAHNFSAVDDRVSSSQIPNCDLSKAGSAMESAKDFAKQGQDYQALSFLTDSVLELNSCETGINFVTGKYQQELNIFLYGGTGMLGVALVVIAVLQRFSSSRKQK